MLQSGGVAVVLQSNGVAVVLQSEGGGTSILEEPDLCVCVYMFVFAACTNYIHTYIHAYMCIYVCICGLHELVRGCVLLCEADSMIAISAHIHTYIHTYIHTREAVCCYVKQTR